ncbi:hypothetical protein GUJ93_ZPchr0003g18099 [Zizania palustris]|uniref:Uncharacterized protein n=1 Tax=Zizania palustris TaxID=103762 RepID=A0A8J5VX51_ZIZPA|nr:hypothetical protein GUJ93_ZPchr0003g18099 [Zizania palustris]
MAPTVGVKDYANRMTTTSGLHGFDLAAALLCSNLFEYLLYSKPAACREWYDNVEEWPKEQHFINSHQSSNECNEEHFGFK